jgi:hypothetical protein
MQWSSARLWAVLCVWVTVGCAAGVERDPPLEPEVDAASEGAAPAVPTPGGGEPVSPGGGQAGGQGGGGGTGVAGSQGPGSPSPGGPADHDPARQ